MKNKMKMDVWCGQCLVWWMSYHPSFVSLLGWLPSVAVNNMSLHSIVIKLCTMRGLVIEIRILQYSAKLAKQGVPRFLNFLNPHWKRSKHGIKN